MTPTLADHERRVVDIPRFKEEIEKLKQVVAERKVKGLPPMTETEASHFVPYTYDISDMIVRKLLQQEDDCMYKIRLMIHLFEQQQKGDLSFSDMDKTFGLAMAQLYFPESAKEDLETSEKAKLALISDLQQPPQ